MQQYLRSFLLPLFVMLLSVFASSAYAQTVPSIASISPTSGPVGTSVTITGTNFTGATGVTFNGTAATGFTVNSTTQITAIVPDGATTGNVVVASDNGSSYGIGFIVPVGPIITVTFGFTGAPQTFTVPANTYSITVDARGAPGSEGYSCEMGVPCPGGKGARVQATLAVTPGQVLTLYVGGSTVEPGYNYPGAVMPGGYNGGGGGIGGTGCWWGGAGGGASDVRAGGTTLADRVLVAAGGGGGGPDDDYYSKHNGEYPTGGDGGAPNGVDGHISGYPGGPSPNPSQGATQTSGYALGQGGGPTVDNGCCQQSGGGGGYYGGYASSPQRASMGGGGGGGSSYVTPTGSSNVQMTAGGSNGYQGEILIILNQSVAAPTLTSLSPTSGPVGTSVTITGTDLDGATGVTFNGTASTAYTVNSATQITATVPAGATTGNVAVTNAYGNSNTLPFTVIAVPPTITSLSPTIGVTGTSVTITGTKFTGATGVTFGGMAATSFTVNSATQITAIVPAGAASGNVVVTHASGNSNGVSFTVLSITTGTVENTLCPNGNLSFPYTAAGSYKAGNTFTAQLSDAAGAFTNAITIGSANAIASGSINATIPANTTAGTGYRIRVVSSDPGVTGTDNGNDITITALATFYRDDDADGYGDNSNPIQNCSAPQGYVTDNTDCDDSKASVHPGATEVCNGIDDNCDGQIDEGFDADGDGYTSCNGDCDGNNANVHPGATEVCNGIDDDCDGQIDEGVKTTYYRDADGDGYGNASVNTQACSAPNGYVSNSTDCDDTMPSIHPGAVEVCGNGIDDNCNGQIDENCGSVPRISINNITVYESEGVAVLTISSDRVSTSAISINYATQSGTAIGSGKGAKTFDFTSASGSVMIAVGTKTAQIRITITKDNIAELAENFKVNLSLDAKNAKKATIARSSGIVTINDGLNPALTSSQIQSKSNREIISESISITARLNPSSYQFTLRFNSAGKAPAILRVIDAVGRVMETKTQVRPGTDIIFGMDYKPGIYFAVAIQEGKKVVVKLLKQTK